MYPTSVVNFSVLIWSWLGNNHTESIVLETGTTGVNAYSITANRPQEGDLIFFPLVNKIFEIKYVEHEDIFYQTGRL